MPTTVHRPPKIIAFNSNGMGRQAYEVKEQLQHFKIDVILFSETQPKPHMRFYIPNYDIYRTGRQDWHIGGTAVAVKKGIPHRCADLPPLLSAEATGVWIPIGNTEMLHASVYKSPQRLWGDTDNTELLGFRNKSILAGDLNAKHTVWNSRNSDPSGLKLL
jgi:exonuclease III